MKMYLRVAWKKSPDQMKWRHISEQRRLLWLSKTQYFGQFRVWIREEVGVIFEEVGSQNNEDNEGFVLH